MKKLNRQGFSAVEGLLIVVIVGVIGFVGWYVMNAKKNTDSASSQQSTATTPIIETYKKTTTVPKDWKTFTSTKYKLSFSYPSNWVIVPYIPKPNQYTKYDVANDTFDYRKLLAEFNFSRKTELQMRVAAIDILDQSVDTTIQQFENNVNDNDKTTGSTSQFTSKNFTFGANKLTVLTLSKSDSKSSKDDEKDYYFQANGYSYNFYTATAPSEVPKEIAIILDSIKIN